MFFEKKVKEIFSSTLLKRADDTGAVFYYSAEDFEGLSTLGYEFFGNRGQRLVGSFYFYGEMSCERIVVFDHGMGGGHRSYMKEIERLASFGYTVLAYDHTGCMESEGEHIGGFSQSLADLDHLLLSLKLDPKYAKASVSVVGHSWGGFSTLNISALHPHISHVVAISGFTSVKRILRQYLAGPLRLYVPAILRMEREANRTYADFDAVESLKSSKTKALIIHSPDDKAVSFSGHFLRLKKRLADRENTVFLAPEGKGHNPNYTQDAVRYKDEFSEKLSAFFKSEKASDEKARSDFKSSFDWARMTAQDNAVWDEIFKFLEN